MQATPYNSFVLHGYSPWSAEQIVSAVDRGTPLAELPGDFVAVAEGASEGQPFVRIVSSTVAACPYYYARRAGGPLAHGKTLFDVLRASGLPWSWNRRAIASLALLEHTVGGDSLHPDVHRVPPASVITGHGDRVTVDVREETWRTLLTPSSPTDPDAAVEVLRDVFAEMAAPDAVVSLSSGFDSRLLLALALRSGLKPRALTMGDDESTDVKVARKIARALGLEHQVVPLRPEDYLTHARAIVALTSGEKTASHWHTDLYVRAAGLPRETVHYVGSNGEFARTFYLDRGALTRSAALLPSALLEPFLLVKLVKRARRLPPSVVALGPGPRELAAHVAALVTPYARRFGEALDGLYTTQRVRHFVGMGLALYAAHGRPRSPFLDARWLRAIAHLPRDERLGSNYHRRAIAAIYPELLDFPVGEGGVMDRHAPRMYHVRKTPNLGYSPVPRVLADTRVQGIVIESRSLDDLLPRAEREAIARGRSPAMSSLLALHFAREIYGQDR